MRKLLLCLTAAFVVAGCSSEPDRPISGTTASPAQPARTALASALDQAQRRSSAASMPDRGALLAFDAVRAPVREGATTLYPIRLSEAHALNAAAPGRSIAIATPDGKTLNFAYASHTEDALGNWTWVGNTLEGLSAVITFGEDAVFGQIALPGTAPLQLTTRHGRTWLGMIDPSRAKSAHLLRKGRPDVLIPRIAAAAGAVVAGGKATPAQPGFAVKASPANTVDVLLGYTPGMVTTYGSASGVNTRLTNLIAIANAAYERSQVTPRVRLVHTMQVNYTDTNSNEAALNALSGYVCNPNCTPAAVPAELQPLRNARDQYGADLVSLVRPLRAPQHQGCGIAWLVGGDLDTIDNSYAPFGYSLVSDGQDLDETDGNTYLCYAETLAHEMGHNMGQAHNTQDSNSPGTHSYSYGYREASTTGFFTIMAYPLANGSQYPISYFANPGVNDSGTGRVTGTASANNALSLNQSMPLVAQFRAAVVPFGNAPRNDFDGDGKSDIAWWNPAGGYFAYWKMNGNAFVSASNYFFGTNVEPSATGRSTGGAASEIVMRRPSDRYLLSYRPSVSGPVPTAIGQYADGWIIAGQGDINGDGKDDLFWRHPVEGYFAYWLMDGTTFLGAQTYAPPPAFAIAAIADFNGDGRADILWDAPSGPSMSVWLSVGNGFTVSQIGSYSTEWRTLGAGDVDGDGKADILWRNSTNTYLAYWRMDGGTFLGFNATPTPTDYEYQTTADYNGDGLVDVLWMRPSDRQLFMWLGNGTNFGGYAVGQSGTGWTLVK